jgi:hypothetical protein
MKLKPEILSNYCISSQFDSALCDRGQTERSRSLKTKLYKLLFAFTLLFSVAIVNAQQIKATARLDSTNILLGDQIKLFLEIDYPKNTKVEFPQIPDSLSGFIEVLNKSKIDTVDLADRAFQKQIRWYTITSFDSGSYRIAPQWFKININGTIDSVPTNSVTLNVYSMKIDTTRGLTDIKMPYGAPVTLKEVTPYILGVMLIGAIIFLILYSIRRKKKNMPFFALPVKPKEPPHIIALRELDRIKNEKIWQKDKTKQYYSEVTDVLRNYIEDRFEIRAMEETTDEILDNFMYRKDLLSEKSYQYLSQILSLADLVKFAKYKTLPDDDNITLVNSYFFVNDTKKEEPKKPEITEKSLENSAEVNSNIEKDV